MRNIHFVLYVTLLLFLSSGCQNTSERKVERNSIDLPNNLVINLEDNNVNEVETARIHKAKFLEIDPDFAANQLLAEEIHTKEIYAMGEQFQTVGEDMKEYLTVYDGGKAFGKYNDAINGGFIYSKYFRDKDIPYSTVVSREPGPPSFATQMDKYDLNSDFQTFVDLDFMSYDDAEQAILDWFAKTGIKDIETEVVYALDEETMNLHYKRYLDVSGEESSIKWTKEEEAYLFHLKQVVDDIPLINQIWQKEVRKGNEVTETVLDVIFNKHGVYLSDIRQLYDVLESSEEQELISSQEALQTLVEHYHSVIIATETTVDQMDLYYVGVVDGDHYQLIPAWVFRIAELKENALEDGTSQKYYDYSFYVINAISGKRIEKTSDSQ